MPERSVVAVRMSDVFNQLRAVMARTDPYRAERMRWEATIVLCALLAEAKRWEGRSAMPQYRKGAMLDAVAIGSGLEIMRGIEQYMAGLDPPVEESDLT